MKVKLLTYWKDENLECCCPLQNKCNKNHGCEELDFLLDDKFNVSDCMKHDSYSRHKCAIRQR